MNYRWSFVVVLGTLMALPLCTVQAHEDTAPSANEDKHHWKHDGEHGFKDGLTDEQKAKLKTIREAQEKALKPLWRKQRDLSIKLADQLEDKAGDADIQRTLSDLKAAHETMETESKRFKSQREAVLTPTQQARMMLAHRFGGGRHSGDEKMGHWHEDGRSLDDHQDHHSDSMHGADDGHEM